MKKSVAFIIFPGFQLVDLAAATVFELANKLPSGPYYDIRTYSEHGGTVVSSVGIGVESLPFSGQVFDSLIVCGGMEKFVSAPSFLESLRSMSAASRRTASICTGAFILAEAGLLDGRRTTTHWNTARDLQRLYPKVKVDENRIFINDDNFWSSAGMTACVDLGLALVEQDLGIDVARAIARKMVVYHRRSGGQSQFSALLELEPKSDRIQMALRYAKENLRKPLSLDELASAANLSRRQFTRLFRLETGQTPAKAVERLRVEAAKTMIEDTSHPLDVVARENGFADPERMRRAFLRVFGQPPLVIKRAARLAA